MPSRIISRPTSINSECCPSPHTLRQKSTYMETVLSPISHSFHMSHLFSDTISDDFQEFLDFLGTKVELLGWSKHAGGLDTSDDASTGTHSYYSNSLDPLSGPIMFHVGPMIPSKGKDPSRKRCDNCSISPLSSLLIPSHIGNDVVVILFNESKHPVDLSVFRSQFNRTSVTFSNSQKPTLRRLRCGAKSE